MHLTHKKDIYLFNIGRYFESNILNINKTKFFLYILSYWDCKPLLSQKHGCHFTKLNAFKNCLVWAFHEKT